jgi:hypothetical protein
MSSRRLAAGSPSARRCPDREQAARAVWMALLLAPPFWGTVWWVHHPPAAPDASVLVAEPRVPLPAPPRRSCREWQRAMQQSLVDCPPPVAPPRRAAPLRYLGPGDFPVRRAPLGS